MISSVLSGFKKTKQIVQYHQIIFLSVIKLFTTLFILTRDKFLLTFFAQQKMLGVGTVAVLSGLTRDDGAKHGTFSCCGVGKNFFGPPKTFLKELKL